MGKDQKTFRPSSYNIIVPLRREIEKYILVHGYTGAIDIANENIVGLLQKPFVRRDQGIVSDETFDSLVSRGYLTEKTEEEEYQFCGRWANFMHKWKKMFGNRTFMLMVTYDCNFRCPYCYERAVSNGGSGWSEKTFTKEMVDRAFQAMLEIEPDINRHSKMITLYGGEPLLAKNHDIVKYIVEKGTGLGYKFGAISNGYEIDQYTDLLGPDKIAEIQISVDGPKEVHDRRRIHYINGGTFDKILNNISIALEKNVRINLRANTDRTNIDQIEALYRQLSEMGYVGNPKFNFSAALVVGKENITPTENVISVDGKIPHLLSKSEFNSRMLQTKVPGQHKEMWIYRKLYNAMKHNALLDLTPVYCGVQVSAYILDPMGDIYNCWETVGKREHIIGHYRDSISWEPEKDKWHCHNISTVQKCSRCKYAMLCGGGCMAKALTAYNDLSKSYCHSFQNIFGRIVNDAYETININ